MADPSYYTSEAFAKAQDAADPLKDFHEEFLIPSKQDLKRKTLAGGFDIHDSDDDDDEEDEEDSDDNDDDEPSEDGTPSTYLCGNSLGLQPKLIFTYVNRYLETWATQGVFGHFKPLEDQLTSPWLNIDDDAKESLGKIVGAKSDEVAVMQTLTANLHLLMASFYKPTKEKHKIIIEGKAFPSDHYAVESQIRHHGFDPSTSMITIEPPKADSPYLPTPHILSIIDKHASSTALILLPGIQFYTGQFLDIGKITAHAHSHGITIGWDLAHAVGNVPLQLHDWNVDFAAWCHYKYMNCGPGAIGGLFVHEKHGKVDGASHTPRLSGWWGSDKSSRFRMENKFVPIPGASGWQLSNPSALDITAVLASLKVFDKTSMLDIREKSSKLTGYLKSLLQPYMTNEELEDWQKLFEVITPHNPAERGAQLSLRLKSGLLEKVMEVLESEGVVVDERRPDVIRVAPAPLYNSYQDAWTFVQVFKKALRVAVKEGGQGGRSVQDEGAKKVAP